MLDLSSLFNTDLASLVDQPILFVSGLFLSVAVYSFGTITYKVFIPLSEQSAQCLCCITLSSNSLNELECPAFHEALFACPLAL